MKYKNLYKFRVMNTNALACLANCNLWFSKLDDLNDPFEGIYDIDTLVDNMTRQELFDLAHKILSISRPAENVDQRTDYLIGLYLAKGQMSFEVAAKKFVKEMVRKTMTEMRKHSGVLSLSSDKPTEDHKFDLMESNVANLHMWSLYSDGLRGFALHFDGEELTRSITELNDSKFAFNPVNYDIKAASPKLAVDKSEIIDSSSLFQALNTKHEIFSNEVEFRVLSKSFGLKKYSPESLKHVFIGERMPSGQVELLKLIVNSKYKNTKMLRVVTIKNSFHIELKELEED
ncbi:DUF2971 domain-containing protein [Pseudoalteromonas rubra]|uniref:DUF2971 domain-containing protein n=1 Tax=Pseudoalteromonas rubra TaxID=43658 RepID=UPI0013DE4F11|nr:DUF2971 domain-containing protein [Pseudoalteromonas rubra]